MPSPYAEIPVEGWREVTNRLIEAHPLDRELILETALLCWERLWATTVGTGDTGFKLTELSPPATVTGYFLEKLFSKELAKRLPGVWVGGTGSQKDLHCLTDELMSVEMKSSGQLGYKVYGNRSYGQQIENADAAKKDKSGYYITINFSGDVLTLLRFGWIDGDDWQAQRSATGQMAGLGENVYRHKLVPIVGPYMLKGPVNLVAGVGPGAAKAFAEIGVRTIVDLIEASEGDLPPKLRKFGAIARAEYEGSY
ncbi:ScaI family restriction endonuclease [Xanthomonas nasturtii]|uniref:ScaI family restriction endonuclease n=1 Tax=Xanthomonas nasturtii TaxID=1843581 RepID=UPI002B239EF0|nr:ScaI family restriction endonuclease [Xanthomonas nasturtii]MEA9578109.1 ScaI family restriction endonuclease [Xanthomonas nasturtii]